MMQKKAKSKCQEKCDTSKWVPQMSECCCHKITECLLQIPCSHECTVNDKWEKCKGAIMQEADQVLQKIILEQTKTWFYNECQNVTEKKTAYKLTRVKCHTENAVKNYQEKFGKDVA